jgi:hypothetical protein
MIIYLAPYILSSHFSPTTATKNKVIKICSIFNKVAEFLNFHKSVDKVGWSSFGGRIPF